MRESLYKVYDNCQTGDIMFFRSPIDCNPVNWIGLLIRYFTKSLYNHCGIVITIWGVKMLIEAGKNGVVMVPLEWRLKHYKGEICIKRPIKPVIEKEFSIKLMAELGKKYDVKLLIYFHVLYLLLIVC